ncbi:MAG TPA: hypothetical protein VJN01_03370, partial [Xanthomonadales bacterium]|nr:hypothetical protein [Xanthomonadales bacterium]
MKNLSLAIYPLNYVLVAGVSLVLCCTAWAQQAEVVTEPQATAPAAVINPLKTRDELQTAYQKEYAFLDAQLQDLQARKAEFETSSAQAEKDRQASIDRIEGEYIAAQTRSERINEMLEEAERQVAAVEDSRNTLEATFLQASATLESLDQKDGNSPWKFDPETADSTNISSLFDTTFGILQQQGRLRSEAGNFFLADGTEVEGTILKVG